MAKFGDGQDGDGVGSGKNWGEGAVEFKKILGRGIKKKGQRAVQVVPRTGLLMFNRCRCFFSSFFPYSFFV